MANSKNTPAIADEQNTALVAADDYSAYAGSGFENQSSDDYSIPFITILQALSPQLEDNPDLRQGMIINTVTNEAVDGKKGIAFIPATTQHVYVEFKPREQGGGFVGVHNPTSQVVINAKNASQSFGKYATPAGNELIETFYVYGIVVGDDGSNSQAVLAFTSTKIKKYKNWMTKAKTIQIALPDGRRIPAPLFAHRYRLTTAAEKNNKGSFHNWEINFDGENAVAARLAPNDPLFQSADAIRKLVETGSAKVDHNSGTNAEASSVSGADDNPF